MRRAVFLCAAIAAGCGGGGSSPGGGTPPVTPTPSQTAQGVVRDLGAQRYANDGKTPGPPIAGATVIVGSTRIAGATPPPTTPAGDARALTQADGSYSVVGFTAGSPTYIMVFAPAADPHIALHGRANLGSPQSLYLYAPTPSETAELAQVNSDRSSNGAGPVIFDEIAFETARAHADFMAANGYYQHCIPASNCVVVSGVSTTPPSSYAPQYASPNDLYNYLGGALQLPPAANSSENFVFNETSWSAADAWFMAEKGTASHGHFDNIVLPAHTWVGLGDNQSPKPPASFGLYLQEFY
jgi:uncharacterized protein YkwD